MNTKIFLQGFGSKQSVNTSEGLNMSLKGKRKLLPTNDMAEVISQYDQYMSEREECNKIRLTCQVNPICSNVLFNRISEIVKDEGSSAVTYLNYGVSGDVHVFDNVEYKPSTMSFWSGGSMHYQSDNPLKNEKDTPIADIVDEGFGQLRNLDSGRIHPTNAIRDMQLSKGEDHFVYHCGLDILNNHLIRSNTFKTICKVSDELSGDTIEEGGYTAFNTIADLMRNVEGQMVIEKLPFPITAGVDKNVKIIPMHLYEYDDIYSFSKCIENRLISKYNGWVGFENKSKIKSYIDFNTDRDMEMERPIMYMNGGDFVDMYPDRTLYSFVPKYNRFRDRIEKNWNYCITYPSSSTTEGFESIIQTNNNSLKAFYFDENTRADNGTKQLVIYSIAKHGLSSGDYVNIYNTVSGVTEKIIDNAEVLEIVDDYIFTVFNTDVQISREWVEISNEDYSGGTISINGRTYEISQDHSYCSYIDPSNNTKKNYYIIDNDSNRVNLDDDAQELSYKKVVNDIECDYYVRIFSKLPNFKYASADTSSEYEIYKNNGELINIYQDREYDFESHVSRLAFARNIYSDEIGELVFTDDIDISNLKDNLGRPLSSIYLTIVKNNKGYKEWYGFDYSGETLNVNEINSPNVEYSHCFGKIKCGIETSDESRFDDSIPSIYTISRDDRMPYPFNVDNINNGREYNNSAYTIDEHEVWFDTDKHYYGDLSYYDGYNAIERHIQPIMHRFNTAQRESLSSESAKYYRHLVYDEITNDDYDKNDKYTIKTNAIDNSNNKHEGYYYNPHYEIPIKTFDKVQTMMPDFLTMTSLVNTNNGARISVLENHYLSIGDKAILYDLDKNVYYTCITVKGDKDNYKMFTCNIYDENGNQVLINDLYPTYDVDIDSEEYDSSYDLSNFKLFKLDNLDIPSYARILKDGTCRLIWRNILNNGFNSNDDTVEEYPFTNGAFYINRRIDLYVRRQDPYAFYGLYDDDDIEGNGLDITIEDNYVKEKDIVC